MICPINSSLALSFLALVGTAVCAAPAPRKRSYQHVTVKGTGEEIFQLGNITYLADNLDPATFQPAHDLVLLENSILPLVHIVANTPVLTASFLQDVIDRYAREDDVFSEEFLEALYITSVNTSASLDDSALQFLSSLEPSNIFLGDAFKDQASNFSGPLSITVLSATHEQSIPAGPFLGKVSEQGLSISRVFRLYTDHYRAFVDGVYESNNGTGNFVSLSYFTPEWSLPSIPVPSRIYSWSDDRPLAGERFGVKDIFNIQGLVTTSGSVSWTMISEPSNVTAPAIQRILDLGGVVVGKTKTSQFASAAEPWDWNDVYPPQNPRGDGWLSCSASSAGSACSIAAYDWLDFAIGTDTGTSMRRPAAVAGVYGQRPSQGRMTLDHVTPISLATDSAGVFCRDPHKWVKFSQLWYTPALYQNTSLTSLPVYNTTQALGSPKRFLYPTDYLPLKNPAAETILQGFLANVSNAFNMTVEEFNWTASIGRLSQPAGFNLTQLLSNLLVLWSYDQIQLVGKPLISKYQAQYGSYPPLEKPMRTSFLSTQYTSELHEQALNVRRLAAAAHEAEIQFSTADACSESIILSEIGTGGLPSYREKDLNVSPNASILAPPGTAGTSGDFCPFFGCIDATVPIGEVPYWSNITMKEELVPVTIGLVAKRGCDLMLYDFIEKLADAGLLKSVKTGVKPF